LLFWLAITAPGFTLFAYEFTDLNGSAAPLLCHPIIMRIFRAFILRSSPARIQIIGVSFRARSHRVVTPLINRIPVPPSWLDADSRSVSLYILAMQPSAVSSWIIRLFVYEDFSLSPRSHRCRCGRQLDQLPPRPNFKHEALGQHTPIQQEKKTLTPRSTLRCPGRGGHPRSRYQPAGVICRPPGARRPRNKARSRSRDRECAGHIDDVVSFPEEVFAPDGGGFCRRQTRRVAVSVESAITRFRGPSILLMRLTGFPGPLRQRQIFPSRGLSRFHIVR